MVAQAEDGLTLQDLAQRLQITPSAAHNLARTLLAKRFLVKGNRPIRYRLGPASCELADTHRGRQLLQHAETALRQLVGHFPDATVTLTETIGGEVMTILRISPDRPNIVQRPTGLVMPPYTSANSLVFQAFWSEEERFAYQQRYPFSEYGTHIWHTSEQFEQFLNTVRQYQYAALPVDASGLLRVAVPLFSATHALTASIGVSMHVSPNRRHSVTEKIIAAAREAARSINT